MKRSIVLLFLLLGAVVLPAQQDGPFPPAGTENQPLESCLICTGAIWDSTENVSAVDEQFSTVILDPYLTCFQTTCYRSRYLTCYNFGFNIPANAVIEGVSVDVLGVPDANGAVRDCTIALRRDNMNNLWGNNMAGNSPWNVNNPLHTYGAPDDLWGLTWTPADVNSGDFGTYIKLQNTSNQYHAVNIDAVFITVTYSLNMEVHSVTSSPQAVTMNFDASQAVLNVTMLSAAPAHISIVDMNGRVCVVNDANFGGACLEHSREAQVDNSVQIDLSSLVPGIYTAVVEQNGEVFPRKFIR